MSRIRRSDADRLPSDEQWQAITVHETAYRQAWWITILDDNEPVRLETRSARRQVDRVELDWNDADWWWPDSP